MTRVLLAILLVVTTVDQARVPMFRIRRPVTTDLVTCTTTTANLTQATVQSAINAAADGAVVCLPAGSATWSSGTAFSTTKAITLAGQASVNGGSGTTTITNNSVLGMNGTLNAGNTKRYRITGITFSGGGNNQIWFYGSGSASMTGLRIDHNTFTGQTADSKIILFGDNGSCNQIFGVIDHNTVTNASSVQISEGYTNAACTPTTGHRGTASNLYFENNTITITTMTNAGLGCIDMQGGTSIVWRYNTTTNCLVTSHGVTHGWGPVNWEVYGNTFVATSGMDAGFQDGSRFFHHQGSGEILVWNNVFTPLNGTGDTGMIHLMHYRSASPAEAGYSIAGQCDGNDASDGNRTPSGTYFGYPCKRQPGRDTAGTLQPIYVWLNRRSDSGVLIALTCQNHPSETPPPATCTHHIVANRDYYSAVSKDPQTSPTSPFDGTTGMGYGTLVNRPTTCTTGSEAADAGHGGVGYWATDTNTLYRCSATDTWTPHYQPYTYPHPFIGT